MKHLILVIDDEEGIRELYHAEMESEGYRVQTTADSAMAWKILEKEKVHLIVLDIKLKGESGLELLRKLSCVHPEIPVIIASAYSSYRSDFSSWLAEGYVVKSANTSGLLAEVARVMSKFYCAGRKKA
jgi:DNA-binding NtrC family response regulator